MQEKITQVSWQDVATHVKAVNPDLFAIIEQDSSLKPDVLYLLHYDYGDTVGDDKCFYFADGTRSKEVPFCMVYENYFEMFVALNNSCAPWKVYKPGWVFPYSKFLPDNRLYDPNDLLRMTAGIRQSFMLMNQFSDKKHHNLLQKHYHFSQQPPKSLNDQFHTFKAICKAEQSQWRASLLQFPKSWEEKAKKSLLFLNYLGTINSKGNIFKNNIIVFDYLFNVINAEHKILSNSFAKEVMRYLFFIAYGDQPGYSATIDEQNAPIKLLREAYVNVFKSDSNPIFMAPNKLIPFESQEVIYYSLNKNDFLLRPKQVSNMNKLTSEIKCAFELFCQQINRLTIAENTIFHRSASNINLDLIHRWTHKGSQDTQLPEFISNDKAMLQQYNDYTQLETPVNSQFLSSCFSINYLKSMNLLS